MCGDVSQATASPLGYIAASSPLPYTLSVCGDVSQATASPLGYIAASSPLPYSVLTEQLAYCGC